jgi:hypothetical protein
MNKVTITALIIASVTLISLSLTLNHYVKKYNTEKNEKLRYQNNLYNSQFTIDSLQLSNGSYQYNINALTVTLDDFQTINDSLYQELQQQKLKIKNLSSVTTINSQLKAKIDSLSIVKQEVIVIRDTINNTTKTSGKYRASYKDKFIAVAESITIPIPDQSVKVEDIVPVITDINIDIDNKLTISDERIYYKKKWWQFWKHKKLQNHQIHITTDNPYLNINEVRTYTFE